MAEIQWHSHQRDIAAANNTQTKDQLTQINRRNILREFKRQVGNTFTVRSTAAAVLLLALSTAGAVGVQKTIAKTDLFYKVYVNGQFVGTVKDPNFVYGKLAELDDKTSKISIVPVHQKIHDGTSEADVSLALNHAGHPGTNAVMIVIDGHEIAAVADEASAKAVLDSIKAKFASGDNTVKEVRISQKVDFKAVSINRDEVRSVDSVVSLLLEGKEKPKKYLVSRGESFTAIAARNQMSVEKLQHANPQIQNINMLHEGEEIAVSSVEPLVTVETVEQMVRTVPLEPEVIYQDDATMNKGDEKVLNPGQAGQKLQTVQIRKQNGNAVAEIVMSEQITQAKTDKVVLRGTKINPTSASGDWVWPVASHSISSQYGEWRGSRQHLALDISAPIGTDVYASNHGIVVYAGWDGEYGKCIRISHGNGVVSIYGHLSSIEVSTGQQISKGSRIGAVGSTGQSTGPHLHYEVQVNGARVNPAPYM